MILLNKVKESYKNRIDVVFTSFVADSKRNIKNFLKEREFNWATIFNQRDYLRKVLNIIVFPTYINISKKGVISRVVQGYSELEVALANECKKSKYFQAINHLLK